MVNSESKDPAQNLETGQLSDHSYFYDLRFYHTFLPCEKTLRKSAWENIFFN